MCEKIEKCDDGFTLVDNIFGAGCCPGCVKILDKNSRRCPVDSLLEQCENGLECIPSKGICDVPEKRGSCLLEYHLRRIFSEQARKFYIPGERGTGLDRFTMPIQYASEMELPNCDQITGNYKIKQISKNKAFCVTPSDGKNIFGVADFPEGNDVTCQCANALYDILNVKGSKDREMVEKKIIDHYSDTHMKCSETGDYHPMQCINETCLCLHSGSGVPLTTLGDHKTLERKNDLEELRQKVAARDSGKPRKDDEQEDTTEGLPEEDLDKLTSNEVRAPAVVAFGAFKALPCCKF